MQSPHSPQSALACIQAESYFKLLPVASSHMTPSSSEGAATQTHNQVAKAFIYIFNLMIARQMAVPLTKDTNTLTQILQIHWE